MKQRFLACILLTLLICSAFVTQLENNKIEKHIPIVAATKMNVLYVGLDNPLQIAISGVKEENTKVEVPKGVIEKVGAGSYTVRVKEGGEVMINLIGENEEGEILNYSIPFRAKYIPTPIAKVGRESGGAMKAGEFKAQQGLRAGLANFSLCANYRVNSFQLTMIKSGEPMKTVTNKGARYEEHTKALINQAAAGDIFMYEKINATGPDSVAVDVEPIFYRII